MIDKFCEYLTNKIRKKMPEINDEKAEIIMYGIQLIIGEIPKFFILIAVALILKIWWQTLLAFLLLLPYKITSGGFHLKTHLGCILATNIIYCGNAYISTIYNFPNQVIKYITIAIIWTVGIMLVSIYAPADTENVPIISKKERKTKRLLSYIFLSINMIVAIFVPNRIISNILIFGTTIQTFSITRIAYIITKNKYGHEEYIKAQQQSA